MKKRKALVIFLFFILAGFIYFNDFPKVFSESETELEKTVSYLQSQTQSAWSSMALAGAGAEAIDLNHLKSVPQDQKSALTYAKYILALAANGENPATFGDENYVEKLKSYFKSEQFGDDTMVNDDIWALLALGSVGQENSSLAQKAKDFILNHQAPDGGWGYGIGASSDTNDTAAAIMALLEAGVVSDSASLQKAIAYLKNKQNNDGGFLYDSSISTSSDACSDGWVISAIYKLGQNPAGSEWTKNGKTGLDSLKSLQDSEGGFWWQKPGDNKFCTPYALVALLGKSYPVQTPFNLHQIRIEGQNQNICNVLANGGTALDLVIAASNACGFDYSIIEYPGMGLYLDKINQETSWMYMVNNVSPAMGADSYYLAKGDEVLWFNGDWLDKGWFSTKVELTKTSTEVNVQVKYYEPQKKAWENLTKQAKIQVGDQELVSDVSGKLTLALSALKEGLYPVFVQRQINDNIGYIRSDKVNLTVGEAPQEHQIGLKVEVEAIKPPAGGEQTSISFSLSPDVLDFGKLKAGQSSIKNLNVVNGDSAIFLQTEVNGDSIFKDNLKVEQILWQESSVQLEKQEQRNLTVGLTVPSTYSGDTGAKEGELTFWALKK